MNQNYILAFLCSLLPLLVLAVILNAQRQVHRLDPNKNEACIVLISKDRATEADFSEENVKAAQTVGNEVLAFIIEKNYLRQNHLPDPDPDASIREDGATALTIAAERGHISEMRKLIYRGATPEIGGESDISPIRIAVTHGYIDIVKMLISEYRVKLGDGTLDIPIQGIGNTLLYRAIERKNIDDAEFLLNKGARADCADENTGMTPLMQASEVGYADGVKLLLRKGADANCRVSVGHKKAEGVTALHLAANEGHFEIVKMLISSGAKSGASYRYKDGSIVTAYSLAKENGYYQIAEYLSKKLAQ